jgi:4-amino-4-deoxy-L-arabinose transferase-like glycosyltransferase
MSKSEYWLFRFLHKQRYLLAAIVVIVIAAGVRFYKLGEVPHGLAWDEAAIGYNGFAILTTRRDEWLQFLPVSFKSFGDYKAPLAIYLNGFFTAIAGLTPFGVRLPFALSGVAAVAGIVLLFERLWYPDRQSRFFGLAAGALLALSPWHIQYSRTAFESVMMLAMVIWGLLLLDIGLGNNVKARAKKTIRFALFTIIGLGLMVGSLYSYHSAKVGVPLLIFLFLLRHISNLKKSVGTLAVAFILSALILLPLVKDSLYGSGLQRAGVTIFAQEKPSSDIVLTIISNIFAHFAPGFLVFGETTTLRHGNGAWGVLFATTAIAMILGILVTLYRLVNFKKLKQEFKPPAQRGLLFLVWTLIGVLPAAIGTEIPHSNRSMLALPGFLGLALVGLDYGLFKLRKSKLNQAWRGSRGEKNLLLKTILGSAVMLHVVFFLAFAEYYFDEYAKISAEAFSDGYLEMMEYVKEYESQADRVIISSQYRQPYIYTLFSKKTNPIDYQGAALSYYLYLDEVTDKTLEWNDAIVVATALDKVSFEKANRIIYGSDGSPRFAVFLPSGD